MTTRTYVLQANAPAGTARARVAHLDSCPAVSAPWSPPLSVRPWRPSTVDPDGPRCPPRSASATTKDHQAVGATRRPSCFCTTSSARTALEPRPSTDQPESSRYQGSEWRCSPSSQSKRPRPSENRCGRTSRCCNDGSGSMTELFFSEQLDDIAAAKAFCGGCPVRDECLDGARRAARAVGCVGWRAVRPRKDRRPEAQAGPPAEGASRRARGAKRLITRRDGRAGTTNVS